MGISPPIMECWLFFLRAVETIKIFSDNLNYFYILCDCDIWRLHLRFQDENCCKQHFALNGTSKVLFQCLCRTSWGCNHTNIDLKTVGINDPSIILLQQPHSGFFLWPLHQKITQGPPVKKQKNGKSSLNFNQVRFAMLNGKSSRIHPPSLGWNSLYHRLQLPRQDYPI